MKLLWNLIVFIALFVEIENEGENAAAPVDYPCDHNILIVYDNSNGFGKKELFENEKNALLGHVFKNWTRYNRLALWSYADEVIAHKYGELEDRTAIETFINNNEMVKKAPSLCEVFKKLSNWSKEGITFPYVVIFVSTFDENDFNLKCYDVTNEFQPKINYLTFVITQDAKARNLNYFFHQAQYIEWDMAAKVPFNWEWLFLTSFGCHDNNDKLNQYPCGSRILFGVDIASGDLSPDNFLKQKSFLIDKVFTTKWTLFSNLAIVRYAESVPGIYDFGTFESLTSLHDAVQNYVQNGTDSSLCVLFHALTFMYIQGASIILFVGRFNKKVEVSCQGHAQVVRQSVNSILFITMSTDNVNKVELERLFPQAYFLAWNVEKTAFPDNFESTLQSAYGCAEYVSYGDEYPCDSKVLISYTYSQDLNPYGHQKLLNFLLDKVFIDSWTQFDKLAMFKYDDYRKNFNGYGSFAYLTNVKRFIRESVQDDFALLSFCNVTSRLNNQDDIAGSNIIMFVSTFNGDDVDLYCIGNATRLASVTNITFIVLTDRVNSTNLFELFPNASQIFWDIENKTENEDGPSKWQQPLWQAFGCGGLSPIVTPTPSPPTTIKQKTKQMTSTMSGMQTSSQTTRKTTATERTTSTSTGPATTTTDNSGHKKSSVNPVYILIGVFVPLFLLTILVVVLCFCWYRKKQRKKIIDNMAFRKISSVPSECFQTRDSDLWEIRQEDIEIYFNKKLGHGAFANVYLGKIFGNAPIKSVYSGVVAVSHYCDCEVAVKVLPRHATDAAREDFQQETNFMKSLKYHVHIVSLLGYTKNLMLVVEYCANGDLLSYLRSNKSNFNSADDKDCLRTRDLVSFAWQTANGLEYLSNLDLIHRDVAARNVLLDKELTCKLRDFGLCRLGDMQNYKSRGRHLPVRWMPIEVLKNLEFTMKTDVWSYGVFLYELFTLGNLPFGELRNPQILAYLEDGNRLEQPEHASDEMYNLMQNCWQTDPERRSTFVEISQKLTPILEISNFYYNYINAVETSSEVDVV